MIYHRKTRRATSPWNAKSQFSNPRLPSIAAFDPRMGLPSIAAFERRRVPCVLFVTLVPADEIVRLSPLRTAAPISVFQHFRVSAFPGDPHFIQHFKEFQTCSKQESFPPASTEIDPFPKGGVALKTITPITPIIP
jgi:hypothetical protein